MTPTQLRKAPRLSIHTLRVLKALLACSDDEWLSGSDLWRSLRIETGTLYPILSRLEEAGWLSSEWENENLSPEERAKFYKEVRRPRMRFYWLTPTGREQAKKSLSSL